MNLAQSWPTKPTSQLLIRSAVAYWLRSVCAHMQHLKTEIDPKVATGVVGPSDDKRNRMHARPMDRPNSPKMLQQQHEDGKRSSYDVALHYRACP
ncbi:hypothetical protein AXG93_4642s1010 [Marchantia polymorpha subsp. ruderalis]|uniref:Uncharacterized protein n=1 Tax=Marchantia polymorpha subsp. ruderalis TaxID=1480154 RepID=A0A176VWV0_MARPO|nr:hypothetical protein AXG93_4642s1010 [Marchantia polymorpha subsp. ruderalis]